MSFRLNAKMSYFSFFFLFFYPCLGAIIFPFDKLTFFVIYICNGVAEQSYFDVVMGGGILFLVYLSNNGLTRQLPTEEGWKADCGSRKK